MDKHEDFGEYLPHVADAVGTNIVFGNDAGTSLGRLILAAYARDCVGIVPNWPMRIYPSYAFMYLLKGQGHYQDANGYRQAVSAGDLILVFPDLPHMYGSDPGTRWDEFYMVFEGPQFDLIRAAGLLDPLHPVRRLLPVDYWLGRFHEVIAAATPEQGIAATGAHMRRIARLVDVFAEALTGTDPVETIGEPWWMAEAKRLLETRLDQKLDIAQVAKQIGVPYDHFRREFRAATGVSPALYRNRRRTQSACELLQYTQMGHRDIADALGFADEFHFSNRFKQSTGKSPREYRKGLLG